MRLEFVEEVQRVASFLLRADDAAADEGRQEGPVVGEAMAAVKIRETSCGGGQRKGKSWQWNVSASCAVWLQADARLPDITGNQ